MPRGLLRRRDGFRSTWAKFAAVVAIVTGGLVLGVPGVGWVPAASAAPSCTPTGGTSHHYVIAYYCGGTRRSTGISGTWQRADMYVTGYATQHYITSEIWAYTTPSRTYMFAEVGLINADDPSLGWSNPCTCTAYQQFWGDEDGVGQYFFHWLANISPSSTTDSYAVISVGTSSDHWDIDKDGSLVGTSTDQVSKTAWEVASGADQYKTFNTYDHATTFTMHDSIATNYSWTDPAWVGTYNSKACGSAPCFNQRIASNDEWSWNGN